MTNGAPMASRDHTGAGRVSGWHDSSCAVHRKRLYASRARARKAARHAHGEHLREYRCDQQDDMWHIGHLPADVRQGRRTARQIYDTGDTDA